MIHLRDVHLTLGSQAGQVNILRGIDFDVTAGETVACVGPSGAGKTSMLMIVGGLERPTSGSVQVADTELTGLDEDALARFRRDNVGVVFQGFHLVPTMTALENVAVPLEFAGRADAFDRAAAALERVGLGHRLTHYPAQLSGGEQQRVAVARAFAVEPKLLLADEPTGNLDGATGEAVMELLFELQAQHNSTFLLITHDRRLAERCGRMVQIADGQLSEPRRAREAAAE